MNGFQTSVIAGTVRLVNNLRCFENVASVDWAPHCPEWQLFSARLCQCWSPEATRL